jgi:hypothetical protein
MLLPLAAFDVNRALAEIGIRERRVPAELGESRSLPHLTRETLEASREADNHLAVLGRVPQVPRPPVNVFSRDRLGLCAVAHERSLEAHN